MFHAQNAEKIGYYIFISGVFGYCGYKLFNQKVVEIEKRALELQAMEEKFKLRSIQDSAKSNGSTPTNFVKLQDFKKKIYVIGVYDDPLTQMVEPEGIDHKDISIQLFEREEGEAY